MSSGKLDLTSYQFERLGLVKLDGEWELYWQKFYGPQDFKRQLPQASGFIQLPNSWNSFLYQGEKLPGKGYATYRGTVKLPQSNLMLAIKLPPISTAYKLYVQGELLASTGAISQKKGSPEYDPKIVEFTNTSREVEFIFQISNHHHRKGGIGHTLRFGLKKQVYAYQKQINITTFFLVGSIIVMALYHMGLFWIRRKNIASLYFGLLCTNSALRLLTINEYFIKDLYYLDWAASLRLEYFTMNVGVIPTTLMLHELFPKEIGQRLILVINIIFGLLTAFVLVFPAEIFTQSVAISQTSILLLGLYSFVLLSKSIARKREGAVLYMIGYALFILTIVNDVLYNEDVIETGNLFAVGIFCFIFFQAIILARRFSNAFIQAETLSQELNYTNQNLEKLVEDRTQDLKTSNTKLNRSLEELDASNEKLLKLDKFKQQMMGMIVHDLKNPLNSIIGLSNHQQDPRFFENIHQSGQRMYHLVMNILDVQKFEESKMQLQVTDMRVEEVIREAVEQTNYFIQGKQHEVILHLLPDAAIKADREITVRILINLLTNAAKYTPQAGQIDIFVKDEDDLEGFYKILVKDSGVGIPADQVTNIFNKFHQVDQKKLGRVRSTGLGLTFCKLAVEAQKGKIGVESEKGKGATFWFTIPIGKLMSTDVQNGRHPNSQPTKASILQALNNEEKSLLVPVIANITGLEIYQTSKIKEALVELKSSDSEIIQYWINEIEDTLFAHDEKRFQELLNIIDQ
ncbi:hypothetical protein BKI52_34385 [marine bacterium AO1-C]|nr:hypothetical protein BKI52_34385 [marine bacterium AO1-C]